MPMMEKEALTGAGADTGGPGAVFFGRRFTLDFSFMLVRADPGAGRAGFQLVGSGAAPDADGGKLSLLANCRTVFAEFTTNRCALAICFLNCRVLRRAPFFIASNRTLMPKSVWAISS
jgi:hypothetical protein